MVDIRWDAHSCVPLKADYDLASLKRHRDAGFDFVSINVGMDMTPIADVVSMIASFREQIARCPDFLPARSIEDVRAAAQQNKLAVGFDLEGAKPLLANPSTVALYAELGVRQVLLAYNRANEAAGGCYEAGAPLTALGAEFVCACEEAGIVVDCSHMNEETVMRIMEIAQKPVVFSHSNARVLNGNLRNITDDMIDACAGLGGVIGVNGVSVFMPGGEAEADAMIRVIDYLAERVGTRHVGIGLDYVYDLELEELPEGNGPRLLVSAGARIRRRLIQEPRFRLAGSSRRPEHAVGGARLRRRRHCGHHGGELSPRGRAVLVPAIVTGSGP